MNKQTQDLKFYWNQAKILEPQKPKLAFYCRFYIFLEMTKMNEQLHIEILGDFAEQLKKHLISKKHI